MKAYNTSYYCNKSPYNMHPNEKYYHSSRYCAVWNVNIKTLFVYK